MAHRMRSDCVLGSLGIWQAATAALLLHAVSVRLCCAPCTSAVAVAGKAVQCVRSALRSSCACADDARMMMMMIYFIYLFMMMMFFFPFF